MEEERVRREGKDHDPAKTLSTGDDRDRTAEGRDERAHSHDAVSEARDERSEARDRRAEARERAADIVDAGAVSDREGALRDRRGGASDRVHASDDREAASADRAASARERVVTSIDELTGAHRREAGMVALDREVSRAKRTGQPFTLAFIDVDKLKATNDTLGHAAGDQRLRETVQAVRDRLRPYDLIIRFGGDEFLCALLDLAEPEAVERFPLVEADLASKGGVSMSVGLAELTDADTVEGLIARADAEMYRHRG